MHSRDNVSRVSEIKNMIFFPARRTRTQRLSVHKIGMTLSGRLSEQLSRSDVSLRLAICFLVLVGLVLALQSWCRPPFPYRLGDDFPNGMLARIDFSPINQTKTEVARLERERRVPPMFRVVPGEVERLRNLPMDLKHHLIEVIDVNRFS